MGLCSSSTSIIEDCDSSTHLNILTTRGGFSITACCRSAGRRCSPFSHATGPCGSEKIAPSTILAWEERGFSPTLTMGGKHAHEGGSGTAQTAPAAAGVLATTPLDRMPHWPPPGVGGTVSLAPGNAPFFLLGILDHRRRLLHRT